MEPLSNDEKMEMRALLAKFYGEQAFNWKVTLSTYRELGRLLERTRACDQIVDLVPRPLGPGSVVQWSRKQVRDFVLRKLRSSQGKHYILCMKASALAMKNDFYLSGFR